MALDDIDMHTFQSGSNVIVPEVEWAEPAKRLRAALAAAGQQAGESGT